jgi:two-component system response regulator AtoC
MCHRKCLYSFGIDPPTCARLVPFCTSCAIVLPRPALDPHTRAAVRETAKARASEGASDTAGVFLLVVGRDAYATYDLPASGALTIGRGESNAVRVDDPLASRAHACLHVGDAMYLEDVGSVNGTRVKDRVVKPGERVRITIGETIQIGSSVLIVQRRAAQADLIRPETLRDEGMAITLAPPNPRAGEAMRRVHELAQRAAAGTINVLITGETGVGKELLAETVHRASPRHGGPYVCLNCAALSETLLESELFGHERGAFTGAVQAKLGLLETAAHGTLFLDEVGELPLSTQAKLLRVIETREVARLGSVRPHRIDVRFIAATNRDLEAEVVRGAFRADLYYRLNGITLTIPPLRSRLEEIRPLAETFLRQICRDLGRQPPMLPPASVAHLEAHGWPGNIRELKNVIERAVLLCEGQILEPQHMPLERPLTESQKLPTTSPAPPASKTARNERDRIIEALASCAGNQSRAAKMLGIPRRTFVSKLDAYQIPRPKKGV